MRELGWGPGPAHANVCRSLFKRWVGVRRDEQEGEEAEPLGPLSPWKPTTAEWAMLLPAPVGLSSYLLVN